MKLRVLHLEDDAGDVELVRSMLAREGFDCDILAVDCGADYLSALQHSQFDLILSDSGVPGYEGRAALSAAHERCPDVPFIVLSGNPELADARRDAEANGAAACVAKTELERLGTAIRQVLSKSTTPPPDAPASPAHRMQELVAAVQSLERRVAERTAELGRRTTELEVLNRELEAFSYSVAHDLRSPLITIDGFSQVLLENAADQLDQTNREHLERISVAVRRMHRLINDLLDLSKIVRTPMHATSVDLSELAMEIAQELREDAPARIAEFVIAERITVEGDAGLLRTALEHLLTNAWKFTARQARAIIEFGTRTDRTGHLAYYVRDNGVGFDPRYATRLFNPFQRLHPASQFAGSGIGLATVQRIIHRHGGEVWAESAVDRGACFYFTLPPTP
jgi:signal transduction histidine kinase